MNVDREIAQKTRRSVLVGGLATLAGAGAWEWLRTRTQVGGLAWPLRTALQTNERLTKGYFRDTRLARTFPASALQSGRVNGDIGLDDDVDPAWKLAVAGIGPQGKAVTIDLEQIRALPKVEMNTELKCIEGWSRVLNWGGVRFRDFVAAYAPEQTKSATYVALETPDREYYVGLDMASALHPQTLLCYEMHGKALTPEHGAPLRLVIPVKYGIKNLKRIGKITFSQTRTPDYWADNGYDWYAGF